MKAISRLSAGIAASVLLNSVLLPAGGRIAPVTGKSRAAVVSAEDSFGLRERLVFRVQWSPPWYLFFLPPVEAGEVTLSLESDAQYDGKKASRIVFTARSSGTLVRLAGIKIDDCFEFVTDPATFCTRFVTKKIREGNRMRDIDLTYLPETRQLHMREVDVSGPVPRVIRDKDYESIPPCVKDLFSALYALRRDRLELGLLRRVLVGDDLHVKEVEIRVEKKAKVSTPAGDYQAWQVDTKAVLGGLFKSGGQFRIWLSADERKVPVKFEASVNLGKVTGSLQEARFRE